MGKHSCLCFSVCHPCRFNNTISFCVFWSSCATRKLVFSRSVHSEFWSSRFPEDFWFFFCFLLGVRMMLQARASKIVSRAGFDATTDISNRKCRALYAIFQFFWSLPQCFFFLQSLKSEIVPICVSRFVITIDLAKELDSEYLIFVSQYYSFGVSVERISREILVFVSWPGGRCCERASMISWGTGFDATDNYNRKWSVACSTFQSFFVTQVWHRCSLFLRAKFYVRHHSLLRL